MKELKDCVSSSEIAEYYCDKAGYTTWCVESVYFREGTLMMNFALIKGKTRRVVGNIHLIEEVVPAYFEKLSYYSKIILRYMGDVANTKSGIILPEVDIIAEYQRASLIYPELFGFNLRCTYILSIR